MNQFIQLSGNRGRLDEQSVKRLLRNYLRLTGKPVSLNNFAGPYPSHFV
jgi:hypothetical protein